MIARVVFNLPLDRAFDYAVPESMRAHIASGARVLAPFGPRKLVGYIQQLASVSNISQLKSLLALLDETSVLSPERMHLADWMRGYYGCSLGEAYACMAPSGLRRRHDAHEPALSAIGVEQPPAPPARLSSEPGRARRSRRSP